MLRSGNPKNDHIMLLRKRRALVGAGVTFLAVLIVTGSIGIARSVDSKNDIVATSSNEISAAEVGKRNFLICNKSIKRGMQLSRIGEGFSCNVALANKDYLPDNTVSNLDSVKDLYAIDDIQAFSLLKKDDFVEKLPESAIRIAPGMRRAIIAVDFNSNFKDMRAGSRVDIGLTKKTKDNEVVSGVIIENAKVVEAPEEKQEGLRLRSNGPATQVTVEISAADVDKLNTARQVGQIYLSLRDEYDAKAAQGQKFSSDNLNFEPSVKKEVVAKPSKEECKRGVVKSGDQSYILNCDGDLVLPGE